MPPGTPSVPIRLVILLDYRVRASQRTDQLRIPFDLTTGGV